MNSAVFGLTQAWETWIIIKEHDNEITLQERLQVEKIILDLDSKISSLSIKIATTNQKTWDDSIEFINNWMKENNHEVRYMTFGSLYTIPKKSREKIFKLLNYKWWNPSSSAGLEGV